MWICEASSARSGVVLLQEKEVFFPREVMETPLLTGYDSVSGSVLHALGKM